MSDNYDRGKAFELKIAKMLRLKIDKHAQRNKGSHSNWNRRSDIYSELPIHIEAKDHETVKIKEWFRQAEEAAFGKIPTVVWQMDADVMATLRFDDLLNLFVEIADQKLEIAELRQPRAMDIEVHEKDGAFMKGTIAPARITDGSLKREVKLCKNGHICTPGRDSCMTKNCIYSSTYKAPRAIKERK